MAVQGPGANRVHDAYLGALLDELASRGIAAERLLPRGRPADLSPEALAELCSRAVALSEDPTLGLHYGLRINLASHGILGHALMSCKNGDQLLSLLTRYAALSVPHVALGRVLRGDRVLLTCRPTGDLFSRSFFVELVLATLVAAGRNLFQRRIPGAEAWLDYPPPAHAEAFKLLEIPVRFHQPYSALVCHRRFLDLEIGSANPALAELCARQCEALLATMRRRAGVAEEVRKALLTATGTFPDLSQMAQQLAVSDRTLRRRLAAEGTSFRAISDEVRLALASRYLATTDLPANEIALLLGYDNPGNFRRAFRRWTATTPQAYRDAHPAGGHSGGDGAKDREQ